MSSLSRLRAAAAATGTGALLVAGLALGSPANAADVAPRSSAATSTIAPAAGRPSVASSTPSGVVPASCGVGMTRADAATHVFSMSIDGETFNQEDFGQMRFGGLVQAPLEITLTGMSGNDPSVLYYHAALPDGTLWRVTRTNAGLFSKKVATSAAWGQVKSMVTASSGQLYVLFSSGTLARYRLGTGGVIAGSAVVSAGPSWKFARSLGWTAGGNFQGQPVDGLLVITESGNLNEYLVNLATRRVSGFNLKTGWNAYAHATSGGCDTGDGVPIFAVTNSGNGYLWYDRDGYNLSGADLGPVGLKATRLFGSLAD